MTTKSSVNQPTSARRSARRPSFTSSTLLLGATVAIGLVVVPFAAQASASAPTNCSKVTSASVSSVVGHSVPAGVFSTENVAATKASGGISAVVSECIYGSLASLAAAPKAVIIGSQLTSKPMTGADLKKSLGQVQGLGFKITPYSGLGMNAFYYSFHEGGLYFQGIEAIHGTTDYVSTLYTKTRAVAQLASLIRLAETL